MRKEEEKGDLPLQLQRRAYFLVGVAKCGVWNGVQWHYLLLLLLL